MLGDDLRDQRLAQAVTQEHVAGACGISRSRYSRIENGLAANLGVVELATLASVLGLDSAVRLFPGGPPVRDAAHAGRLGDLLSHARPPLTYRLEVPMPADGRWERRAWDAVLFGHGERTAIELEMRLRDVQAARRRHELKRRDDPTERFLLLVADTRTNRRVIAEFPEVFEGLPRLRPSVVRAALEKGQPPPTGLLLV